MSFKITTKMFFVVLFQLMISSFSYAKHISNCAIKNDSSQAIYLIGRNFLNPEMRLQLSCLGVATIKNYSDDTYYIYPNLGMEFVVTNNTNTLKAFIFNLNMNSKSLVNRYNGQLPRGLTYKSNQQEVWRKLGVPNKSLEDDNSIPTWESFMLQSPNGLFYNVGITYSKILGDNKNQKIDHLVISQSK